MMWSGPPSWIWAHVDGAAGSQSVARACCDFFAGEGVRRLRLCRTADVESTEVGQGNDAAVRRWLDRARLGRILLESDVSARAVVVAEVAAQTTMEVSVVEDNHVVEQFASDGADHALGEGFCQGERGAVRTTVVPMPFTRCRNSPPKMLSRSRSKSESSGNAPNANPV